MLMNLRIKFWPHDVITKELFPLILFAQASQYNIDNVYCIIVHSFGKGRLPEHNIFKNFCLEKFRHSKRSCIFDGTIMAEIISKSIPIINHYWTLSEYLGQARHLPAELAHDIHLTFNNEL